MRRGHRGGLTPTHKVFRSLATPWPDEFTVKLRYRTYTSNITTTVSKTLVQFRGNGPFDPDVPLGGGQPKGYDQWATMYDYQFAAGSRVKATLNVQPGTLSNQTVVFAIWPAEAGSVTAGTPYKDGERSFSKFAECQSQTKGPKTLTNYMTTKKLFGLPTAEDQQASYASQVGAVPVEEWYWNVTAQNHDLLNNVVFSIDFEVDYYITFYARKDPADAVDTKEGKKEQKRDPLTANVKSVKTPIVMRRYSEDGSVIITDGETGLEIDVDGPKKEPPPKFKLPSRK